MMQPSAELLNLSILDIYGSPGYTFRPPNDAHEMEQYPNDIRKSQSGQPLTFQGGSSLVAHP